MQSLNYHVSAEYPLSHLIHFNVTRIVESFINPFFVAHKVTQPQRNHFFLNFSWFLVCTGRIFILSYSTEIVHCSRTNSKHD